ncbi:hypothetical protein EVAR_38652_1 [Eumeta japonica]|uniref:Uncharacterized protein n=1 Tax=Eumeta variegata TaxID=151549 RepID=A0A4C1Y1Z1_EUMVA|nr:hypothetical protein EVAR_38652_1 [Eumeta japonica]
MQTVHIVKISDRHSTLREEMILPAYIRTWSSSYCVVIGCTQPAPAADGDRSGGDGVRAATRSAARAAPPAARRPPRALIAICGRMPSRCAGLSGGLR